MTIASDRFASAVGDALADYDGTRLWIAFSGGADSTALLVAAAAVAGGRPQLELSALHVNHGLSPHADTWQSHCERVCNALQVGLVCDRVAVPAQGNLEANARRARYDAFRNRVGDGERLLLAHHQDDQVATLLMRLFQGRGLTGMRRRGGLGRGEFARPFIGFARQDLLAYVEQAGYDWIEDPGNQDDSFDRNFIRHRVSDVIAQRWPDWQQRVLRVARHEQGVSEALRHALGEVPDQLQLNLLPPANPARRIWLRQYLSLRAIYAVTDAALDAFLVDVDAARAARLELVTIDDCRAVLRFYQNCIYFERLAAEHAVIEMTVAPGAAVALGWGVLRVERADASSRSGAGPDDDAKHFTYTDHLRVRACRQSDRLQTGPAQFARVSELLRTAGIPPWRRTGYPVLCDALGVLCIPGVRTASRAGGDAHATRARAFIESY